MGNRSVPVGLFMIGGATAIGGAIAGIAGGLQIGNARKRIRRQGDRHDQRYATHLEIVGSTNEALRELGGIQERAQSEVISRMRDFLIRHSKLVRTHEHFILDGVDGGAVRVAGLSKNAPDVAGWVRGVVSAAGTGVTAPLTINAAVLKFASASTGTPISELNGAAAEKARLAFLGGGSLKSGGGGVKLGKTAGGAAAVGPAILVAGLAVKNQGTKARTEADRHLSEVEVAIATFDTRDELLRGVQKRTRELEQLLARMILRAIDALDVLDSQPFDIAVHAERLQNALILVRGVRELATAPVADEEGNIDMKTEQLIFTYRDAYEERAHG
ncbi:hypothetical protein GCM10027058_29400 [Microbacterium neimengense]